LDIEEGEEGRRMKGRRDRKLRSLERRE